LATSRAALAADTGSARTRQRCAWLRNPLAIDYHDREWGVPIYDDRLLFEYLILEGAQAGLSWDTVLAKRDNYRVAFDGFDPVKVACYGTARKAKLLANPGIIRNRAKIDATVLNAGSFIAVQREFGSFQRYLWQWVQDLPLQSGAARGQPLPARTELSDALSADLRRRGFKFVGSTIIYAFMQAVGLVNDHCKGCFRRAEVAGLAKHKRRVPVARVR
jgi:DNA-3-methyladenine glycosylase I